MKCAALVLTMMPAVVLAQSEHAYDHHAGRLEIAFTEAEISLSLVAPGAEILEAGRSTEANDTRNLVAAAISDLSKPLDLFVPPDEAGCFTTSANVTLAGEGLGQGGSSLLAGDKENRAEFQADYRLKCQNIEKVNRIQFVYFERFPKAEMLIVKVTGAGGGGAHKATRTSPKLNILTVR